MKPQQGVNARIRGLLAAIASAALAAAAAPCPAQTGGWKPARNVEIIVGVSPGGGIDRTARAIQKIMQDKRLLEVKAVGGDAKKLKVVVFRSGGESMTALLGGHVGLVVTPSGNTLRHLQSGAMRVLAVAAPRRLDGPLAVVPTWKEQGVDVVVANWRPVVGPKGLSAAQVAFWEDVFAKITQSEEWKNEIEKAGGVNHYMNSRELRKYFEAQHAEFRAILTDLGLAK